MEEEDEDYLDQSSRAGGDGRQAFIEGEEELDNKIKDGEKEDKEREAGEEGGGRGVGG